MRSIGVSDGLTPIPESTLTLRVQFGSMSTGFIISTNSTGFITYNSTNTKSLTVVIRTTRTKGVGSLLGLRFNPLLPPTKTPKKAIVQKPL